MTTENSGEWEAMIPRHAISEILQRYANKYPYLHTPVGVGITRCEYRAHKVVFTVLTTTGVPADFAARRLAMLVGYNPNRIRVVCYRNDIWYDYDDPMLSYVKQVLAPMQSTNPEATLTQEQLDRLSDVWQLPWRPVVLGAEATALDYIVRVTFRGGAWEAETVPAIPRGLGSSVVRDTSGADVAVRRLREDIQAHAYDLEAAAGAYHRLWRHTGGA